jgi:hypothetical protein
LPALSERGNLPASIATNPIFCIMEAVAC